MRKVALLLMVVALVIPAQASASPCLLDTDPVGDTTGDIRADAIDLVSVSMSTTAQSLFVELGVVDVDAPLSQPSHEARFATIWHTAGGQSIVVAERAGSSWTFKWAPGYKSAVVIGGDELVSVLDEADFVPISGSVDVRHNLIVFDLPRKLIGSPANGTRLEDIWTAASEYQRIAGRYAHGVAFDDAPEEMGEEPHPSYTLGAGCP